MDTYFSSINDRSFWKTDLFRSETDMGIYKNFVYPCIIPAVFNRTGICRTDVYCNSDSSDCRNCRMAFQNCILKRLKKPSYLFRIWRFLLTVTDTDSIIKKNPGVFPDETAFWLHHFIPIFQNTIRHPERGGDTDVEQSRRQRTG